MYSSEQPAGSQTTGLASQLAAHVYPDILGLPLKNPRVSSVITGASKLAQLQSNLGALAMVDKLTPKVTARSDALTQSLAD